MSKITKNNDKVTKNQSLASEIIAEQSFKNKKLEMAVIALSVVLLATTVTRKK
nr:MAG TPA: hypothetical protein [Caudoviricetes sp.]